MSNWPDQATPGSLHYAAHRELQKKILIAKQKQQKTQHNNLIT